MDGLPQTLIPDSARFLAAPWQQHTLKTAIDCVGVGVHTGRRVRLTFRPADPNHGIVFHRSDLGRDIPARFDSVVDTRLSTVLGDPADPQTRVGTVEHVMAALSAMGIDNVVVEVDGLEAPILDGSAAPFCFLLQCAGLREQDVPRSAIELRRVVRVEEGEAWAELRPLVAHDWPVLDLTVSIDFAAAAIGRQSASLRLSADGFHTDIARARTFALAADIAQLRAAGLAQGGSLDNALVVDGATVLNPGGLRMPQEFARHKLLDAVGDLALAGAPLHAQFVAHRAGHALHNRLMRAVFADRAAWRRVAARPYAAAAA
jgi:UDP-3-O-[3-hydroxymyristoyl] N-acetylglucosamine deacetylase